MSTYETIKMLCDKNKIAVTSLEKELGFGRGSIGKMRSSKTSVDRLQKIADYFGVSLEYIISRDVKDRYSKEESAQISKYLRVITEDRATPLQELLSPLKIRPDDIDKMMEGNYIFSPGTLAQIAGCLNKPIAFFLEKKIVPPDITDDDIKFALFGSPPEEISDDMMDDVKQYAQFVKARKEQEKKKE